MNTPSDQVEATASGLAMAAAARELAEEADERARSAFLERDTNANLEGATRARLRLERAVVLHERAVDAHDRARADYAHAQRAANIDALAARVATLTTWEEQLGPLVDRLVALDREAHAVAVSVARIVGDAQAAHEAAKGEAARLGVGFDVAMPDVGPTLHEVATALAIVRSEEAREDVAQLLATPRGHGDWKTADIPVAERIAQAERSARHAQQVALDNARLAGAAAAVQQGNALLAAHGEKVARAEHTQNVISAALTGEPAPAPLAKDEPAAPIAPTPHPIAVIADAFVTSLGL